MFLSYEAAGGAHTPRNALTGITQFLSGSRPKYGLFIMMIAAAALGGCGAVTSVIPSQNNGDNQNSSLAIPTVQVPLLHVGLQGRPASFKDMFILNAAAHNSQW